MDGNSACCGKLINDVILKFFGSTWLRLTMRILKLNSYRSGSRAQINRVTICKRLILANSFQLLRWRH